MAEKAMGGLGLEICATHKIISHSLESPITHHISISESS